MAEERLRDGGTISMTFALKRDRDARDSEEFLDRMIGSRVRHSAPELEVDDDSITYGVVDIPDSDEAAFTVTASLVASTCAVCGKALGRNGYELDRDPRARAHGPCKRLHDLRVEYGYPDAQTAQEIFARHKREVREGGRNL